MVYMYDLEVPAMEYPGFTGVGAALGIITAAYLIHNKENIVNIIIQKIKS